MEPWSRRRRVLLWSGLLFCLAGVAAIFWVQRERAEQDLRAMVRHAAARYDLDPVLVEAVVRVESSARPRAVSPKQAYGLMQLRVPTASELAGRPVTIEELFDPALNLELGCRYLRQLLDRYGGDLRLALMAYNAGLGNVDKWLRKEPDPDRALQTQAFRQTRAYVAKVEAFAEVLREEAGGR